MEILNDSGFWSGLISSGIVAISFSVLIFVIWKPWISMSPYIAKLEDKTGDTFYKFKFINRSAFVAFDVNMSLEFIKEVSPEDALDHQWRNKIVRPLTLTRDHLDSIPGYRIVRKNSRHAPHCMTIRTYEEDIEKMLHDHETTIILSITLKHGFSSLSRTYKQSFSRNRCLGMIGEDFMFGNQVALVSGKRTPWLNLFGLRFAK